MKTKHTPGPLNAVIIDQSIGIVEAADGSAFAQAQIRGTLRHPDHEVRRENARLIAAPPDGYDFAEAFMNRGKTGITLEALERMAEAFIAKAKGETP